ncbi:MAG TPA: TPM domain-containing protein [Pyrinomonadaceae bacterium]|nr:TPM domain-containing protein [Pyrinomonadaceae bacterium]
MKRADTNQAPTFFTKQATTLLVKVALTFVVVFVAAFAPACGRATRTNVETNTTAFGLAASGRENLCQQEKYARPPLSPPSGTVGDFANALDDAAERRLAERLAALSEESGVGFKVALVETTGGVSRDDYSLALACGWGVAGPRGGALLLVAVEDRQWRIQISRALEKELPDDVLKEIGDEMAGHFRAGNYAEGVEFCAEEMARRLAARRARDANERRNIPTH